MRFDASFKPELCCSTDETRYVLNLCHVKVDGADGVERDGFIEATNGFAIVRVACIIDADDVVAGGLIPPIVMRYARELKSQAVNMAEISMTKTHLIARGVYRGKLVGLTFEREEDWTYPKTDMVFPKPSRTDKPVAEYSLNAKMLHLISDAMATDMDDVEMTFYDRLSPVVIRPVYDQDKAVGLLMPLSKKE